MAGGRSPLLEARPAKLPRPSQPWGHEYLRRGEIWREKETCLGGRSTPTRAQPSGGVKGAPCALTAMRGGSEGVGHIACSLAGAPSRLIAFVNAPRAFPLRWTRPPPDAFHP